METRFTSDLMLSAMDMQKDQFVYMEFSCSTPWSAWTNSRANS
jgi:hypothetical protein